MKIPPLNLSTKLTINPNTVAADLDGGVVIMGHQQEQYYALNEVGGRIWQLIPTGLSLEEIQGVLLAEYDAPAEELWQDVLLLVSDLLQEGLISVQDS